MTSDLNLTNEAGLAAYLGANSVDYTSVAMLTGGTANYVYRVTLQAGRTLIYKHAAPYLHSNKDFAFDPQRMDHEDHALRVLPLLLLNQIPNSSVRAVDRNDYDGEQKLLCIGDGGTRNLKQAYTDSRLNLVKIGKDLGHWIAALHSCSVKTSLSLSDETDLQENNQIAVRIYRHSYNNLEQALSQYGHDTKLAQYINQEFGSRLVTENECVCHGDFWPGNVLVRVEAEEAAKAKLTVVDWEMTRRGTSATDIGQFAAEAFLLDRFCGGHGLQTAFLDAYLTARKADGLEKGRIVNREWIRRMAVHWAVHIAFWPTRVEWTDEQGTQKLVDIGVAVMKAAAEGDWERLATSDLFKHCSEAWGDYWRG